MIANHINRLRKNEFNVYTSAIVDTAQKVGDMPKIIAEIIPISLFFVILSAIKNIITEVSEPKNADIKFILNAVFETGISKKNFPNKNIKRVSWEHGRY